LAIIDSEIAIIFYDGVITISNNIINFERSNISVKNTQYLL